MLKRLAFITLFLAASCSETPDLPDLGLDGASDTLMDPQSDTPTDLANPPDAAEAFGRVDFVPIYETNSAWESEVARTMVDNMFAQFESVLRTSGTWDATVEVYLTDNNEGTASTSRRGVRTTYQGRRVQVDPAWSVIVLGEDPNGPADAEGNGAEFRIDFNVPRHEDNPGLLRHEMMHGLGASGSDPDFTFGTDGQISTWSVGSRFVPTVYDLQLVDLNGNPLLGNYADETFEVLDIQVATDRAQWEDNQGGVFFRGVRNGVSFDMPCGIFGREGGPLTMLLAEPANLMNARAHPNWDSLDEPDYAFLEAMGFNIVVE